VRISYLPYVSMWFNSIDQYHEADIKTTGVKDKIDYFAIVRSIPLHLQPPSENAAMLRKRIEEFKMNRNKRKE
jgi:hypothetical protein